MDIKQLKLKFRDIRNKITGKDKVIEEYQKTTMDIATLSDKEKDPKVKKELRKLYKDVTEEKWKIKENYASVHDSFNPYKSTKKATRKKIEMAQLGLKKIKGGRS